MPLELITKLSRVVGRILYMLSYQHPYHAGNHADCHKHALLCLLLNKLKEKETPFCYMDTHSGRGLYDLTSLEASKLREFNTGITKLWPHQTWPNALKEYRATIDKLNSNGDLRFYSGSPYLAHELMRAGDQLRLYELHPQEFAALEQNMQIFENVTCMNADGWHGLEMPSAPPENRGIVLIDSSFELKEDYTLMAHRLEHAVKKWRNGIYVVWYPLLPSGGHQLMLDTISGSTLRKVLVSEIEFFEINTQKGMYGSGMLIVNPPWQIEEQITDVMDWMTPLIGQSHECYWLIPE